MGSPPSCFLQDERVWVLRWSRSSRYLNLPVNNSLVMALVHYFTQHGMMPYFLPAPHLACTWRLHSAYFFCTTFTATLKSSKTCVHLRPLYTTGVYAFDATPPSMWDSLFSLTDRMSDSSLHSHRTSTKMLCSVSATLNLLK